MTTRHKISAPRVASSLVGILALVGGLVLVGMVVATVAVLVPGSKLCLNRWGGFYGNFSNQEGIISTEGQPVCHPGTTMTLASVGIEMLWPLFSFVVLLLFFRLLRTAAKQGPFHAVVPTRMRTLGLFVAIGGPLTAIVANLLTDVLLYHEYPPSIGPDNLWGFPWITITDIGAYPWFILLVGLGTITFASIMRTGVRMREDLEGTI
ncbi:MAG TPA: hypothetical protein VHX38_14215 [Pseudonocardiaceae bacterium]|nr:hypothetical protein [Pseudonocardiaceae bacterium]